MPMYEITVEEKEKHQQFNIKAHDVMNSDEITM